MNRPFRQKWIMLLAAAVSLSLLLTALACLVPGAAGAVGRAGETVSRPFLRLFSGVSATVSQTVRDGQDYLRGLSRLQEENRTLRAQLTETKQEAALGSLAQRENQRLRALLKLPSTGQARTLTPAQIIGRTPDSWQCTVTLDKGTAHGVAPGQCAIDENGALVGRVKAVGSRWCTLSLLCDPAFSLAGRGASSGVLGTVSGDWTDLPRGQLAFSDLTCSDPILWGEEVLTFAAQETYPSGLLIGTVTSLDEEPGGLTYAGNITPAADLDRLQQVFLITAFEEEGP